MQQLTAAALGALKEQQPIGLALEVGSTAQPVGELLSVKYLAGVNGSGSFPLGRAAAAEAEVLVEGTGLALAGVSACLRWRCGGEDYPLLTGEITEVEELGDRTRVFLYDRLYVFGGKQYEIGENTTGSCTLETVLQEIAAQLGVSLAQETAARAAVISLTEGASPLGETTLLAAAGAAAALLGGNAAIDRAGELVVRGFAEAAFSAECYADSAEREELFTVTGLTMERTITETGTEGEYPTQTTETVTYTAGEETGAVLTLQNNLATQSLTEGALAELTGVSFYPGRYELPGGIQLEPGDVVTLDGSTVAVAGVSMTLDGGCRCTVTSLGRSETGSTNVDSALGAVTAAVQEVQYLVAETAKLTNANIESLRAEMITAEELEVVKADIDNLKATDAELQNAVIGKANIADLNAANAEIENLKATDAELRNAVIGKADIADLNAANANIETLEADVANINSVLAGNVGTGNLQAVHITGDNVVIDDATITDAMIANLSAGKLTAGTIYTSLVKIASDQDENMVLDGSTLQITDTNGVLRIQIGRDGAGDYSLYVWDENGTLLWQPTGITGEGIGSGTIKDVNVAENAAISGSKLDITSVAERLNEDGSLVLDASNVTIDNTTLDVQFKTVTEKTETAQSTADNAQAAADAAQADIDHLQVGGRNLVLQSDAEKHVRNMYLLYTLSDYGIQQVRGNNVMISFDAKSDTDGINIDTYIRAVVDGVGKAAGDTYSKIAGVTTEYRRYAVPFAVSDIDGIVQVAIRSNASVSGGSTTATLYTKNIKVESGNIATDWTPAPEDTEAAIATVTETTSTLETELEVVQGQIESKVWQTDITEITDPLGAKVTALEDNYSTVNQTVEGIETEIGSVKTTVADNYEELDSKIATISATAEGIKTEVSAVKATVENLEIGGRNYAQGTAGPLEQTGDGTANQVSVTGNYTITGLNAGDACVLSFDWTVEDTGSGISGTFRPQIKQSPWLFFFGNSAAQTVTTSSDNTSGHYVYAGTLPEGWNASTVYGVCVRSDSRYGKLTITHLKLEKGTTATDWTPAPEDTESKITTLQDQYSTVTQTVEGIQTEVADVQTTVSDHYTELDSKITTVSTTAEGIRSEVSEVRETVDNLEVGGRNYVLASAEETSVTRSSGNVFLKYNLSDAFRGLSSDATTFTLSADLKSVNASSGFRADMYLRTSSAAASTPVQFAWIPADEYSRYSVTVTLVEGFTPADMMYAYVRIHNGTGTLYGKNIKVERGAIATDWSPAPEDAESKITTLQDQYSTVTQTVEGIETEIGSVKTTVADNYEELDSKIATISATADGIKTEVSDVKASVDNLQVGGRNYLQGTATPLEQTGTGAENETSESYPVTGLNGGEVCVLSFDWTAEDTGSGVSGTFIPQINRTPWTIFSGGTAALTVTTDAEHTGGHSVFSGTITAGWSADTVYGLRIRSDNRYGKLTITHLKLEKGTVATDWTPAPEDADAALSETQSQLQTQISELGTSVTQTAEEIVSEATKSLVTQDEFSSYQEEVSSSFTQQADSFELKITQAVSTVQDQTDANTETLETVTHSIRFTADGNVDLYAVNVRFVDDAGEPISYWDGNTLHTGNLYVDTSERAQFGNFAFQPRSDGSLVFLKVGG